MVANEDSNVSDFPDNRNESWSDLAVCEAYLNLFIHCSWIADRKEYITYIGEGRYRVKSQITLHYGRLLEEDFCPVFDLVDTREKPEGKSDIGKCSAKKAGFVPIFEHAKQPISLELMARHSNGKVAVIAPNEMRWGFETMIILGTVERARKLGYEKFDQTRPTPHLAQALHKELSRDIPRKESDEFLGGFRDSLSNELLEEYNFYAENCPGFELLFFHFVNNRVVFLLVDFDSDGSLYDVVSLDCIEHHFQMNSLNKRFGLSCLRKTGPDDSREKVLRRIKRNFLETLGVCKHEFTYPLRRIGTSESEQFVFTAPKWTMFHPESKNENGGYQYCSILDCCKCYDSEQEESDKAPNPAFSAFGSLTQESLSVRTYSKHFGGKGQKGPRRRFSVFDENEILPAPNKQVHWGEFSLHDMHEYVLHVGWQAKPGKKGRANLVFLGLSALFIILTSLYVCCGVGEKFWNGPTLVPTFTFVVTLLALLYSNLQEEVPYYRYRFMYFSKRAIGVVTILDVIAFLMGLLFGSVDSALIGTFGSAGKFLIEFTQKASTAAPIPVIAFMIIMSIIAVFSFGFMCVWLWYNDERTGKNVKWFNNENDRESYHGFEIDFVQHSLKSSDQ